MPAGDVFGLDGIFLNKSNPVTVSTIGINSTGSSAGIAVTGGSFSSGTVTLNLSNAAGLTTTPFYTGAKIAVYNVNNGYNGTFIVSGFAGTTTVSYATTGYVGSISSPLVSLSGTVLLVNDTQVTNTTWSSAQTHGWFGGGGNPAPSIFSTVDRIDFSNDTGTASVRGPLSLPTYLSAAIGNSNYGWFSGANPTGNTTVNRINFANDSATSSIRGRLSLERYSSAATGNSNYGWFGGGFTPAFPPETLAVDRIDFSNDSSSTSPRGTLSSARYSLAATGNSNYGWYGGGQTYYQFAPGPFITNLVDRIDFSNDSATASVRGPLSFSRGYSLAATGNSNYGWFGGGATPVPSPRVAYSTIERIDFSNDSATISLRGPLSSAKYYISATGNSNYGWFGGGGWIIPSIISTVDRINFANDTTTVSPRGPLSLLRTYISATSGQARSSSTILQKAGNYGWFGGGRSGSPIANISTVDRIDFSNDSATASPRSPLSLARSNLAATGNSNYGWFGGGHSVISTIDRIDFSNDSATASVRGSLASSRYSMGATGNSNYGWFGGGSAFPASTRSTVERINFSNDLVTASRRGSLNPSIGRASLAATGNFNYGWFGGGAATSRVDRIDFSNDSPTASPRSPLSLARSNLAATGNSNYGWFGGGYIPGPSRTSRVDRINFSNDSITASIRGSLGQTIGTTSLAATGNSNYGWFGGGATPGSSLGISTVERINFSNDSVTASVRGLLSATRYVHSATSNSTR